MGFVFVFLVFFFCGGGGIWHPEVLELVEDNTPQLFPKLLCRPPWGKEEGVVPGGAGACPPPYIPRWERAAGAGHAGGRRRRRRRKKKGRRMDGTAAGDPGGG